MILLGTVNAIILAVSLSSLPLRFKKPAKILGLFILFYTLNLSNWMVFPDLGEFFAIPIPWVPTIYFLPALAYYFTKSVMSETVEKKDWFLLIPGVIDTLYQVSNWLYKMYRNRPYSFQMDRGLEYFLYEGVAILFSALCLYGILRLVKETSFRKSATYFFYRSVLYFLLILFIRWTSLYLIDLFKPSILTFKLFFTFWTIDLIFFLFLGYRGLIAPNKYSVRLSKRPVEKSEDQNSKTLVSTIEEGKLYLNPNLTRKELAELLNVSEIKISGILNDDLNTTFYGLINQFRVEESKRLIGEGFTKNMTLDGIGEKSGFRSKTTFYKFFKKITGETPSEYMRRFR